MLHLQVFELLEEPPSPILERLYILLVEAKWETPTEKAPGSLDFNDFLLLTLVCGLMSENDMLRFVFETFDADDSGHLEQVRCKTKYSLGDMLKFRFHAIWRQRTHSGGAPVL